MLALWTSKARRSRRPHKTRITMTMEKQTNTGKSYSATHHTPAAHNSPGFGHEAFAAGFAGVHHASVCGQPVVVEGAQHGVPFSALVTVERLCDAVRLTHVAVPGAAQSEQLATHRAGVARLQLLPVLGGAERQSRREQRR